MPTQDWYFLGKDWLVEARESVLNELGKPSTQNDLAHLLHESGLLPPHRNRISDRRIRGYEAAGRWPVDLGPALEAVIGRPIPTETPVIRGRSRTDRLGELSDTVVVHEQRLHANEQRLIALEQRLELLATELSELGTRLSDTPSADPKRRRTDRP